LNETRIHEYCFSFAEHQFNVKERKRVESLDKEQIEFFYVYLSQSGSYLGAMLSKSGNYKKACDIFDRSISFAYLVERKETRIDLLNVAFTDKGFNFSFENKFNETKVVFEEMYNVFVEAYYPDHSKVLEAANKLISILIDLKEFEVYLHILICIILLLIFRLDFHSFCYKYYNFSEMKQDAEWYARNSYECLTRPVDTESNEVASAAESLATVTFKLLLKYEGEGKDHGDITEAEMLVRKALRIREKMFGRNHICTLASLTVLFEILQFAEGLGNHYDEINDISGRWVYIYYICMNICT
jgi:tetratricopeptide (TPR) repeat protein